MVITPENLPEGTVTILFTGVEGSTDLGNRLGDVAAREILRAADELIREQLARHRGHQVKGLGDGVMVAFTSVRRAVAGEGGEPGRKDDRAADADPERGGVRDVPGPEGARHRAAEGASRHVSRTLALYSRR